MILVVVFHGSGFCLAEGSAMESNTPAGEAVIPYGRVFESLCSVAGEATPITSPVTLHCGG